MILGKLKLYALAILGVITTILAVAVKILTARNSQLSRKAENAEAKVHHAKVVIKKDIEATKDAQKREEKIEDDLADRRTDYDPNELFNRDSDS